MFVNIFLPQSKDGFSLGFQIPLSIFFRREFIVDYVTEPIKEYDVGNKQLLQAYLQIY